MPYPDHDTEIALKILDLLTSNCSAEFTHATTTSITGMGWMDFDAAAWAKVHQGLHEGKECIQAFDYFEVMEKFINCKEIIKNNLFPIKEGIVDRLMYYVCCIDDKKDFPFGWHPPRLSIEELGSFIRNKEYEVIQQHAQKTLQNLEVRLFEMKVKRLAQDECKENPKYRRMWIGDFQQLRYRLVLIDEACKGLINGSVHPLQTSFLLFYIKNMGIDLAGINRLFLLLGGSYDATETEIIPSHVKGF